MLVKLQIDNIRDIIEHDILIIEYSNGYAFKHRHSDHHHQIIRARLRLLGRFLLCLRELNPDIKELSHLFTLENYDYLYAVINQLRKYNATSDLYDSPATAAAAGAYIKEVSELWVTECIKTKKNNAKVEAMDFQLLFNSNFNKYVSRTVAESQVNRQRQKIINLPQATDIKLLYQHINQKRKASLEKLKTKFTFEDWKKLSEYT